MLDGYDDKANVLGAKDVGHNGTCLHPGEEVHRGGVAEKGKRRTKWTNC
jgi:hypothetical protein